LRVVIAPSSGSVGVVREGLVIGGRFAGLCSGVVELGCLAGSIRAGGYWLIFIVVIIVVIIIVSNGLVLVVVSGMWLHTVRLRRI